MLAWCSEHSGWLAAIAIILAAVWVAAIAMTSAPAHDCTGYVRIDPIYRPNIDGTMVREERWLCAEWK